MKNHILKPKIHPSSYIHPSAVVVGNVIIGKNVFICPQTVLRADEVKSKIVIEDFCNIQDGVIIHCLKNSVVKIKSKTSIAHGSIIHGPCIIGKNCFIGFRTTIFNSVIGDNVVIKNSCLIENVKLPNKILVKSGQIIKNSLDLKNLSSVDKETKNFVYSVLKTNYSLKKMYLSQLLDNKNKK